MSSAKVTPPPASSVGDVLNQLDLLVKFTEHARDHEVLAHSDEFMKGYLTGLSSFRRYLRSSEFPHIVRITKETPTNAYRS